MSCITHRDRIIGWSKKMGHTAGFALPGVKSFPWRHACTTCIWLSLSKHTEIWHVTGQCHVFLLRISPSSPVFLLSNIKNCNQQTENYLLPDTLQDPAPHVMVLTPHTSVFTILRQSGTEKVVVGLGPTTKQYQQTCF